MTNTEIKKAIMEATKRLDSYNIEVVLWHDDNMYLEVIMFEDGELVDLEQGLYFGSELEETEENITTLKKEQKKMCEYLKKHFNNVTVTESNV